MPRKIHKAEEIVSKLRQVDVLVSQGTWPAPNQWSKWNVSSGAVVELAPA
jgi:hypothetical protein